MLRFVSPEDFISIAEHDLSHDALSLEMTESDLVHGFGLSVVAEGIENQATLMILKEWGCELAQRYYIARPAAIEPFLEWLNNHQTSNWFTE